MNEAVRALHRAKETMWARAESAKAISELRSQILARIGEKGLERLRKGYAQKEARERKKIERE